MRKYMLLLSGVSACMALALLSLGGGPPQDRQGGLNRVAQRGLGFVVQVYCCDTCKIPSVPPCQPKYLQSMTFSNVMLVANSAADSAWISMLPDTLKFTLAATGPGKKLTLNWPGIRFDNGKGHVSGIK